MVGLSLRSFCMTYERQWAHLEKRSWCDSVNGVESVWITEEKISLL